MPRVEHCSHKGLNNHAENSHLPLRRRERAMQGFRSPGGHKGPSRSFRLCAISSFHPVPAAVPSPSISTASPSWRNGKGRPTSPPEWFKRGNLPQFVRPQLM